MFLIRLWQFNKFTFFLLCGFIVATLIINLKRGMVAAPIFQYGMYSGLYNTSDTQTVIQIKINDRVPDAGLLSFPERDILQTAPMMYMSSKEKNEAVYRVMLGIFTKARAGKLLAKKKYENKISDKDFSKWYASAVSKMVHYPIEKIEANEQKYIYRNDSLIAVLPAQKLTFIEL